MPSGYALPPEVLEMLRSTSRIDVLSPEFQAVLRAAGFGPRCGTATCDIRACWRDANGYDIDGRDRDGFDRDGFDRDGYDRDGFDRDGYDRDGFDRRGYNAFGTHRSETCDPYDDDDGDPYDDYRGRSRLLYYSYKPRYEFRGAPGPYFGMELEVTTDCVSTLVDIVRERAEGLIYCKEDGSVEGAELVTHPMSYDWAMTSFPWDLLPTLRREAQATVIPQENGIHVHVGRDGFADSAHVYRWMKLWYRNPQDIQRIARRRSNHWASFNPEHRAAQREHVKRDKYGYRARYDATLLSRYAAINTTNDDTLEVRVFASTLRPNRAKAALQLVASSVEYTRGLTSEAICHRHGWDWQAYMAWVAKSGRYPELVAEDRNRRQGSRAIG